MKKKSKIAQLHILGSLRDFVQLNPGDDTEMKVKFELSPSAKDLLEGRGIPHTAVFRLEVNGVQHDLDYNINDGDILKIFPFEFIDPEKQDTAFRSPRSFTADVHLRKLAKTLRLLGMDTTWNRRWDDDTIIRHSNRERRMILTRDRGLLKRSSTKFGYWLRSTEPDRQIKEIFERFDIEHNLQPFSRCMECNGLLETVEMKEVEEKIPPKVKEWHSTYYRCRNCNKVYWKGSHYDKLKQKVDELIKY